MFPMRRLLTLALLLLALPLAAEEDWRPERDRDGIRIHSRAVAGWTLREMRGQMRVPGPLASLVAVLGDPAAAPQLNEFVVETRLHRRESAQRYQLYTLTRMPWPLTDRDVLMQRQIRQDAASGAVSIHDEAIAGDLPVKPELVRISRSQQQWTFTPQPGGEVAVELRMLTDPNGPIPSSLLNKLSISTPFDTLARLRELARSPRYAGVRLAFVQEPAAQP